MKDNSLGFTGVLFLIFLVMKLTGHITWSWWWVTAPLWLPFAAIFAFLLGMATLMFIVSFFIPNSQVTFRRRKS